PSIKIPFVFKAVLFMISINDYKDIISAKMKRVFLLFSLTVVFTSCEEDSLEVDISNIKVKTEFSRFDSAFFSTDTSRFERELSRLKNTFPVFFESGGTYTFWKNQRTHELQNELYRQVKPAFGDFTSYQRDLDLAMKHFYYYYPDHPHIDF